MYTKIRHLLSVILFTAVTVNASAQLSQGLPSYTLSPNDTILHFSQRFSINSGELPSFDPLDDFFRHINSIEDCDTTVCIHIIGHASIDGRDELNMRLSQERAYAVRDTIINYFHVDPEKITCSCTGEDWALLQKLVLNDTEIPARNRVLEAIAANWTSEEKESKIRGYAEGKTWEYLNAHIFPEMRSASVAWILSKRALAPAIPVVQQVEPVYREEPEVVRIVEEETVVIEEPAPVVKFDDWRHKLYFKTNVLGWGAAIVNAAIEIDLARHWSFSVAGYWAGWNYYKPTVKFRNGTVIPEFRYWPKGDNTGFFVNMHGGVSWYNVAVGGDYRYQAADNRHPAMGGGLGLGWRFPFCRNKRWMMEASIGGGCYRLEYEKFLNVPQGRSAGTKKKTLFCLDQLTFSFIYALPL